MKKIFFFLAFSLCASPCVLAEDGLKKVSLIPLWIPQAQFAGYMVALDKGFYRKAGIELTLIRGGPDKDPVEMLKSGAATFGVAWLSSALRARSSGIQLVNLAQIVRNCAFLLVADRRRGIEKIEDLRHKRVGMWGGDLNIPPKVFLQRHQVEVREVPNYTTVTLFLKGGIDAVAAMWYNEFHLLINSGVDPEELTVFYLKDHGINFPEDGLYCLRNTYESDPAMCAAFVEASLKGWTYAFDHKEEALGIVMRHAVSGNTGTNRAHQKWMLDRMEDLITPDRNRAVMGKLDPTALREVSDALLGYGMITHPPSLEDFYRGRR
jgi:NitT/TauT family transport system substrate-binding protein